MGNASPESSGVRPLLIIGAGGYAKSVLDSLDYREYRVEGFLDERESKSEHLGHPVVGHSVAAIPDKGRYCWFVAIGNNAKRRRWFDELTSLGLEVISVVDPSAQVSPFARVGRGCFVGKLAVVNAGATVGDDCIVNTMALVEHGCSLADHVNMSTKAVINGDVEVGEGSFIGSSSVAVGQIRIGRRSTVGAGAVVLGNVEDDTTVAGVPARVIGGRSAQC